MDTIKAMLWFIFTALIFQVSLKYLAYDCHTLIALLIPLLAKLIAT